MKKILLSLSLMLLLCGCSVNYDLEINENDFLEKTTIMTDVSQNEVFEDESLSNILDKTKKEYFEPVYFDDQNSNYNNGIKRNVKYYQITNYQNANWQGITASNTFDRTLFYRSDMVNKCFKELDYQNDGTYIMFRTNNKCDVFELYPLLEELTINIKTDLKVVVSNADKVNDNVYTWVINRQNYQNKPVRITYTLNNNVINEEEEEKTKEEEKEEHKVENKKQSSYNKLILIGCFIILIGVLSIVIIMKNKRL